MVDNNDIRTITGGRDRGIEGSENQPFDGSHYPGETEAPLVRLFDPAFEDGFNEPRGGGINQDPLLPNTRDVSNIIAPQGDVRGNPLNASDWLWQWGQFLDHDLGLSEGTNITADPDEEFGIPLSPDDILYGRNGVVFTEIPLARIPAEEGTGVEGEPRTVVNEITTFIDGSNGYGSTYVRAAAKRADLGFSFFGQARGEIVERNGQRFLEVQLEESPLEVEGEEGSEDQNTTETVLIPLPPEGEATFDGKLLVANDSYGTDGLPFAGGSDPNNDSGEILAPYNRNNSPNADPGDRTPNDEEFISGDLRINEQVGLIAIHTLFVREHNLIADKVAFHLDSGDDPALNAAYQEYRDVYVPSLNLGFEPSEAQIRGEFIYEAARTVVAAKNQVITYEEFLPLLIGNESPSDLQVIDESIMSPDLAVEFSGAAFRLGHTLLSDNIRRVGKDGTGSYSLRDAFFTPQTISENGVDDILLGLNYQESNDADHRVIDGVRNNLFRGAGQGGQDLIAINLQRGRELGIPGYVEVYNQLNPDNPIATFEDLNPIFGEEVAALFVEAYDNVEDIDLWLAALAEIPEEGVLLGPTFSAILSDQFARLKEYDRYFYEDQLADEDSFLSVVSNAINLDIGDVRLADVIRDNVSNPELVPDDAFTIPFENEIFGTDGNENIGAARDNSLIGTDAADLIDGRAGNDRILGREGDDIIFGGRGNDELNGQAGADTMIGGAGNDTLIAQGSGDVLSGNEGNDRYELYLSLIDGGVEINDDSGTDALIIKTAPGEEGVPVSVSLTDPGPGRVGIKKSGTDLLLDLNQDGVINPDTDLTITDYFNEEGGAGAGVIETIGEGESAVTSQQLVEYGQRDDITGGFTVYRFFIPSAGVHFYTASEAERDSIIENLPNYQLEGASYVGAPHDEDLLTGAKPVYRFFNRDTGVHLYTISDVEREAVLQLPNYSFEGVAYYAYENEQQGSTPLYRFYNSTVDTHFYTPSAGERDSILANLPDYQLEGGILEDGTVTGINYYIQPLPEA